MYTVEQALARIMEAVVPLSAEIAALPDCVGRVLAEDVYADIPQPPFDNSAVDGYAAQAVDTASASERIPAILACIGDIPAGAWPDMVITPGNCARIMTGASVPAGADAIVMVEDTALLDSGRIAIHATACLGQHIRYAGEDGQVGDLVLAAGTRLRAAQIGLLAQMGRGRVSVVRLPRVAVISTGDEIVEIQQGVIPPPGKIRNSNAYALAALVQETGGVVHSRQHLPDDLNVTRSALQRCAGFAAGGVETNTKNTAALENESINESMQVGSADIIVTAGGVSVGDRDFVKAALESLGTLDLWRVAMKPGKPLAFGRIGRTLFFGLPGNPVSAQVTFELFVRPALLKMAGWSEEHTRRREVQALLTEPVTHLPGRREYLRGITEWRESGYITRLSGGQSSANARSLALANSLLIVPEEATAIAAGETVSVLLLD